MSRFDDLLLLVEVVDAGTLSAAAKRFGMSVSAVSRRLTQMEERLGARLLQRSTRRLALTEVGASFCQRARTILAALEECERTVGEAANEPGGVLRLVAPVSFGELHLAPLLSSFQEAYPKVSLDVTFTHRTPRLVDEGLDVAVHLGALRDSSMVARRLAPLRVGVVGSPDYLGRAGVPKAISDLGRHNCLALALDGNRQDWEFQLGPVRERIKVNGSFQSTSHFLLKAAAVAGRGLVRLPMFMVSNELQTGELLAVLTSIEVEDEAIYAIYPSNRHLSPKVRGFIDHLLSVIGNERYWRDHCLNAYGG